MVAPGCCDARMASREHYTFSEAAEIKRLLGQRLRADREEQKRVRLRLRNLGFRISDFEVGLTPAGFDALAVRGLITVSAASQAEQAVAVPSADHGPDSSVPEGSESVDPINDAMEAVLGALSARPWTFSDAVASCPHVPGLYAIYALARTEPARAGVWEQLRLGQPPDSRPLYVGKSEDDLAGRDVRDHFSGASGNSTVRRSLAALLREELRLRAAPRNPARPGHFANYGLEAQSESRLSQWMADSLELAVWPKWPNAVQLKDAEATVIRLWQPPLNLTHVATPWTAMIKQRRLLMAREARDWTESHD